MVTTTFVQKRGGGQPASPLLWHGVEAISLYWSSCWNNDGSPLLCGAWEKCRTVLDHTIFVYILIHFIILELVRVRRFFRGDYRVCRRRNKIYLRISILQCSVVSVLSAVTCVFAASAAAAARPMGPSGMTQKPPRLCWVAWTVVAPVALREVVLVVVVRPRIPGKNPPLGRLVVVSVLFVAPQGDFSVVVTLSVRLPGKIPPPEATLFSYAVT